GTYAVLGWAAAGVAVAWLARSVREPRLHVGAAVFVALAVAQSIVLQAPPTHLFATRVHPAGGTASIFISAVAVAAVTFFALTELGRLKQFRTAPRWLAGALAVYGLPLLAARAPRGCRGSETAPAPTRAPAVPPTEAT